MSEIIAIISSPRTGCNSETIARSIAEGAKENGKEVRFVHIKDMEMKPCEACNYCKEHDRFRKTEFPNLLTISEPVTA